MTASAVTYYYTQTVIPEVKMCELLDKVPFVYNKKVNETQRRTKKNYKRKIKR